jgi:hypothetical protein
VNYLFLLLFLISCAHEPFKKYSRHDWTHWSDGNHDCLNTRGEILKARSLVRPILNKKGCKVISGKWNDYYYPEVHTIAKKVDIDHLVPLKNAHLSGAARWDRAKKETFANDPENLVITNLSYNRKKGAKGIDAWLPSKKEYACKYIVDWINIKKKYQLAMLEAELNTVRKSECN